MLPFGLFDLLKTLLPTPDQTPDFSPSPSPNIETEPQAEPASKSSPAPSAPLSQPEKTNACADFLYRHEQRAQGVKGTKKRLD